MVDRITPANTAGPRGRGARAHRDRRRLAGGRRAVHAVGARGRLRRRPSRVRGRRCADGRRRRTVRADEAPAPQRRTPDALLRGVPPRVPAVADATRDPLVDSLLRAYMQTEGRPSSHRFPASTSTSTSTRSSNGFATTRSGTPSPGCARSRRTASRSGWCRWYGSGSPPVVRSTSPPRSSPPGPATRRVSTRTVSPSTWSTVGPSNSRRSPRRAAGPGAFVGVRDLFGDLVDEPRFMDPTHARWNPCGRTGPERRSRTCSATADARSTAPSVPKLPAERAETPRRACRNFPPSVRWMRSIVHSTPLRARSAADIRPLGGWFRHARRGVLSRSASGGQS